jgi:hypothetical protein
VPGWRRTPVFPLDRARLASAAGVLRLLDVRCIVLPDDWEPFVTSLGFERAGTLLDGRVASVRAGASAFLPASVVTVARDEDALAARPGAGLRPERRKRSSSLRSRFAASGGQVVRVERPAPGQLRVDATVPNGGYLVVSESWYPGWRALVDGVPAAVEARRLRHDRCAAAAGCRTVELWYAPRGFGAARWATLAGLTLLGPHRARRAALPEMGMSGRRFALWSAAIVLVAAVLRFWGPLARAAALDGASR